MNIMFLSGSTLNSFFIPSLLLLYFLFIIIFFPFFLKFFFFLQLIYKCLCVTFRVSIFSNMISMDTVSLILKWEPLRAYMCLIKLLNESLWHHKEKKASPHSRLATPSIKIIFSLSSQTEGLPLSWNERARHRQKQ